MGVARIVAGGLVLALGGCVNLGGGKAPAMLVRLSATGETPAGAQAYHDAALVVDEPTADRALEAPRIAVAVDDSTVAYLTGAQWLERPSRQFAALLTERLRAHSSRTLVVQSAGPTPPGAVHLGGNLLAMGYDARSHAAVVRFDALRRAATGAITTRRFEASEPVPRADARDVAPALNRLANTVAGQVADWLN